MKAIAVSVLIVGFAILGFLAYPHLIIKQPASAPQQSASSQTATQVSRRIEVRAAQNWVDTGIDVTGKVVKITYESGLWQNHPNSGPCDGAGRSPYAEQDKLIVPEGNLSALVGKTDTRSFVVGNFKEGQLGSGRLFLSINDKPGTYEDNSGSLFVTVTIVN